MTTPDLDEIDTAPFERCDGIHADGAPDQYLCTRCFPYGRTAHDGDLAPDSEDEDRHAEPEEID